MKHGKKYVDSAKLIERSRLYDTAEALELCIKTGTAKFDETVEVHVKLGVDGRHADQQVRGAVVLPHGTGKTVRVLAICKPEKEEEARAAGAENTTYSGAQRTETYFLTVLEAGSPRVECQHGQVLMRAFIPGLPVATFSPCPCVTFSLNTSGE